ncbi:LLM class F420-dependent oxidoreductase [Ktedonosporobacter rubrisoli]|uniref:LLM class F420-dependent oxidoreductase n=1 Tax=Ktedonosporobacter rubrisoli TaxID=2509675 RepID=A0A4P6JK06_KTERU|nr:LLM class F420-dependent oxidoreductase [Ktedonosporobacter rubrisoli]QBD75475.1 LLM class F420-dependent oxidoreductase [Ktedonosporobacter rubrisoli]
MAIQHLFRFGVVVTTGAPSREQWISKARNIENLGYATLLVADHFSHAFSPLVALQAAADATTKLRVGSFVFDNDFRHPAVLAKEVATLDVLTDGRFDLGLGGGWNQEEYQQIGLPFEAAGVRLSRLEESIRIIKGLFADEPATFTGKHYTIHNLDGLPKPVQRPHPPLFIGGGGKRLLTLAAREAEIIGIHYKVNQDGTIDQEEYTSAGLARKVAWIRETAGERFNQLEFNLLIAHVEITENRQQAIERFLQEKRWQNLTIEQVIDMPYVLIGTEEQIIEELLMQREQSHISYFTVFDKHYETFAPIVERLAGR